MDPSRMAYEVKFEKHIHKKIEKQIHDWDYPVEEKPDFDLSCVDFTTSVNVKAM